ncbi:transcriptional regulatory protein OmpR [Clostridium acetireducens DSM 10703]|uniref:Stage 0 sporulation protein A homolog n=1 Tax=Clostridium acetireducens DSM 10703 TaxID=1121290 RepID=A0A1E8F012_9CLOT|nr:response regulator [Clostridium acetireducens]OFI06772.1 transcriptional regulatory protein OmpR [Clostridium acetireducens DSM 10703]
MSFEKGNNIKILVVGDNITLNKIILDILNKKGFYVKCVLNAEDAYAFIKNNYKNTAMILDYILPSINASEFIRNLKNKGYNIPFIMMTSNSDRDTILEMMKLGAYDYIIKNDKFISSFPSVVYKFIDKLEMEMKLIASENKLKEREKNLDYLQKMLKI